MAAILAPGDMITLGVGVLAAIVAILAWWAALQTARANQDVAQANQEMARANQEMVHSAAEANRIQREEIEQMREAEKAAESWHREELALLRAQVSADIARWAEETSSQAHLVSLDWFDGSPLTVGIKNHSTSPVFDVGIIDVLDPDEKRSWSWRATDGDGGWSTLEPKQGKLLVLRQEISGDELPRYGDPNSLGVHPFDRPSIVYGFRDAGGHRWWRLEGGAPVRADVSPWDGEKARIEARRRRPLRIILRSKQERLKNLSKDAEGDPESGTL